MAHDLCSECGAELPEKGHEEQSGAPCPNCGATTRIIDASVELSSRQYFGLGHQIKDPKKTGKSKIKSEGFTKYVKSQKAPLVKHSRNIDRENNLYTESVVDVETGEILHECEEPLKKHTGHGSAKKKST